MKKSLIALAVVGAFTAQAAMADVTIYGTASMSLDSTNNGTTTAGVAGTGATKISSNTSKIGFKGTEDLGGGMSAVWQIEQDVFMDTGANTLATRNTYVGLTGESMGTVLLGQHDTPYKIATRGLDLFADTIADNRSIMGQTGGNGILAPAVPAVSHDARLGNVLAYISPAMSGVTIAAAYVAAAEGATLSTQTKGSAYSLAALYGAGPISASLAYQVVDGGTAPSSIAAVGVLGTGNKASAWKLGGGYTMDAITVNAVYEKTSSSVGGLDVIGQTNYYLGGKFNVSANDAVKLAYAHAGQVGSPAIAASGAKQISIGYDHSMSKRTMVYALYTKLTNDTAAVYGLGGSASNTGGVANLGAGASPSAVSLGLKHSF